MNGRKIEAMHKRFGISQDAVCKNCCHFKTGRWHDKWYHKCELYGMSHSEATDWRCSYQACGMYNVQLDVDSWIDVEADLMHTPKAEPPLEGQIDVTEILGEKEKSYEV